MKTHKDLDVWKKSIMLVTLVYNETNTFPKEEIYGITNQIRRSAVSIPSNIAEGSARQSDKEFLHFLYVSLGSLTELETQLIISKNLKYLTSNNYELIMDRLEEIRKMLLGLIKFIKNK